MGTLKHSLIRPRHKPFQGQNVHPVGVFEVLFQAAAGVEVAELPALAAENKVGLGVFAIGIQDRLGPS